MSSSAASGDAEDAAAGPGIPVICGPTASGKSALALWLARRHAITIISADSRQIYRGFDIGTAKPTPAEQQLVPHRCIDVVEPTRRHSAAEWAELAVSAIREARANGRIPLVVGGTGFYISALFRPLFLEPDLDGVRRLAIQRVLAALPTEELRRWCQALDPARVRFGRAQLLRAVEVALLAGRRLSDLHVSRARAPVFRARYLLLDPGRILAERIASRAASMLEQGWAEEVRALQRDVPEDAPAWRATGYAVMRRFVREEIGRGEALERVVVETRQYAKRQRTWFRNQLVEDEVLRISGAAGGPTESIVERWITDVEAQTGGPA